jgi:hypothetical protein
VPVVASRRRPNRIERWRLVHDVRPALAEIVVAQREAGLASYCLETRNRDRKKWRMGVASGRVVLAGATRYCHLDPQDVERHDSGLNGAEN